MGIPGLTTYMYNHSDVFFEKYKLKDVKLIVDGNSLASMLYCTLTPSYIFGGDYDAYYVMVKEFFINLKRCNVEAIVIFDGGMEEKKLRTYFKRGHEKVARLKDFQRNRLGNMFFPLFMIDTFKTVLIDLEIKYITSVFEADQEIASLACFLNCPVLSCDSDFFIYGCLYIPIDKINYNKLNVEISSDKREFYMECMIYDYKNFEKQFSGGKCVIPYLAALKGNDYVDGKIFKKFFNHISIPSKRYYNQAKMSSLIDWLKSETFESAKMNIIKHLKNIDAPKAMKAIDLTFTSYEILTPRILHQLKLAGDGVDDGVNHFKESKNLSKLPDELLERYRENGLPGYFVDMVHLQKYYPGIQVEDASQQSSHCISFPIISGMYHLASNLVGFKNKLNVMLKVDGQIKQTELNCEANYPPDWDAHSLLISAPNDVKVNFIYKVLSLDDSDISTISLYDNDWRILAMSIIYWLKNSGSFTSESHLQSLVLVILANFVQGSVGYFKSYKNFMKFNAGKLNRLSKKPIDVNGGSDLFADMLNSVSELECLKFTEKFIKLRQFIDDFTEAGYFARTLHIFAMFQSVLHHVSRLNDLLGFPFPRLQVHKIYTGTLAYNLYHVMQKKKNLTVFFNELLKTEPNILRIYNFFVDTFIGYVSVENEKQNFTRPVVGKRSRRSRKKRNRK